MRKELKERVNIVMLSSITWHERTIVIAEAWNGRGENKMQSFRVHTMLVLCQWGPYWFMLRRYYMNTVVSTSLLRPDSTTFSLHKF